MPNPGLSPEEHTRRLAVVQRHIATGYGWKARAAKELEIDRTTLHSWCVTNNIGAEGGNALDSLF